MSVSPPRWAAPFAGLVATGAALAAGELVAGIVPGAPSPIAAIGKVIVDNQPPGAKDVVVALFGTADKLALQVLVLAVALAIGAGVGWLAIRRRTAAGVVIAGFAGVGFLAATNDPATQPTLALGAAAIEAVAGITVLGRLIDRVAGVGAVRAEGRDGRDGRGAMPDWTRRALLRQGGTIAIGSIVVGALGRVLLERGRTPTGSTALPAPPVPAVLSNGADVTVAGLSPIIVPNDAFYRIDTSIIAPSVDRATWRLKVTGLVDQPLEMTYDELAALPIVEHFVTIACVSNEVGGDLVGNAAWRGVPLRTVLKMAGVQPAATQLVGRAVDDFTVGMPVAWVMDESREPLIAIGMNGEPLPREHGYPARLIVPGLYGYVSATKWLAELQLTTFDAFDAYWVKLGWAKEAPILTQSRIDVPVHGTSVNAGHVAVAGVAWAPDRGISKVELAIDGGPWQEARLSTPISDATWVQWLVDWEAAQGTHMLEVRATDGTGQVQTTDESRPFPDGARGHHAIQVRVA
jgi:DMSO/TMAO reductase YedYZ molybdopterin-dependent catalytic subunit